MGLILFILQQQELISIKIDMQCFLPRPINESNRKLSFKHHCQFQNVRPRKVLEAAKYLVQTSELFQNEHIQVQENWLNNVNTQSMIDDWQEFVNSSTNQIDELRSSDPFEELAQKALSNLERVRLMVSLILN